LDRWLQETDCESDQARLVLTEVIFRLLVSLEKGRRREETN